MGMTYCYPLFPGPPNWLPATPWPRVGEPTHLCTILEQHMKYTHNYLSITRNCLHSDADLMRPAEMICRNNVFFLNIFFLSSRSNPLCTTMSFIKSATLNSPKLNFQLPYIYCQKNPFCRHLTDNLWFEVRNRIDWHALNEGILTTT